jgi:AraC-like DNA-binding protein
VAARSVLWADLRTDIGQSDLCASLPKSYGAQRVSTIADLFHAIQRWLPWAVCFEYDRPDASGLEALTETRRLYRSLPVVIVSERHSEDLAAWAFRWCVWDYLVKPLSVRRLCNCLTSIDRAAPPPHLPFEMTSVPVSAPLDRPTPPTYTLPQRSSLERSPLAPAVSYVEHNYSVKVRMGTAARLCDLSPFQFSRHFKKENGFTFRDFVIRVRIQRAAELMRQSKISVTDAAFGVGFNDLSYFARMFRRQLGVSPSHYRTNYTPEQLLLFPSEPSSLTQKTTSASARKS